MTDKTQAVPARSIQPGFFSRTSGQVLGVFMALVVRYIVEFCGQAASYQSAKAYYEAQPRGEWDAGAQLRAAAFSLHGGSDAGRLVGLTVYLTLFLVQCPTNN